MKNTKRSLLTSCVSLLLCFVMLLGTTFAWFTDVATSSGNVIKTGNLDIVLKKGALNENGEWTWTENQGEAIFDYDKWEPGYMTYAALAVENVGSLDARITAKIVLNGTPTILGEVIDVYTYVGGFDNYDPSVRPDFSDGNWQTLGTMADLIGGTGTVLPARNLSAGQRARMIVALHMREDAGNEYQDMDLGANFDIKILATQAASESDSFGNDYDADAEWPNIPIVGNSASANVTLDENNQLTEEVTMTSADGKISATLPVGTKLLPGTTNVKLVISDKENSEANLTLEENEASLSLDVHITNIADDNTMPIKVELGEVLPIGLNLGNHSLYHVENGQTVGMTLLDDTVGTSHNTYAYDPATGEVIVYLASFSELALVADTENAWNGEFNYDWYDESKTELTIANADQLAAFGAIVGGMKKVTERVDNKYTYSDEVIQDSFSGKTVKLISDINLGDKESENNPDIIFYPIGYYNSEKTYEKTGTAITSSLRIFEGTFDGNGHTVKNFYHNTWEMKGDHNWYDATLQYYRDGMGLFGRVYGGTVKNLTVDNFSSDGEIATTGVIAAYADGATFENIAIFNCNPRVYNIGNGGIVGCVGWYAKEADLKTTFKNITVDNSNKISALWGSYDVACGGIVGQYYPTSGQSSAEYPVNAGIHFDNCHVSAVMDVYNDVCANYQYYAYRYTGMLIGSVRENVEQNGHVYPKMDGITASGCTVHFGDWNDYYYCELVANSLASYTHDHQMSRLTQVASVDTVNKTVTDLDGKTTAIPTSGRVNYVVVKAKDANGMWIHGDGQDYAECYHFVNGVQHFHDIADSDNPNPTEMVNGVETLKEDKQLIYREFNNLVTGYGWGVTSKGVGDLAGVTILDREEGNSVVKFNKVDSLKSEYSTETTYTIGEFFKAAAIEDPKLSIKGDKVVVTVSPVIGTNSTVTGTYVANTTDWTQGTLTFSGMGQAVITITDYYFCKTTSITVNIVGAEKFGTNFVNYEKYLYRVGNQNAVTLGTIFKALEGANIDSSSVKIDFATIAGTAAGEHSENTTDWTKGTIQFTGTGVVKVTISADGAKPFELHLEVIDATNLTSASGYVGTEHKNFVLVKDISTSSFVNHWNSTIYGNGFTYSLKGGPTEYDSKQGHGILIAKNTTFDNIVIIGDVYSSYGAYSTQDYYTAAIDATNTTIQNSYIANCSTPVRGNGVTITNTTLYGGTVANLILSGGVNTLTDLITVNYNDGRGVLGLGIVVPNEAADTTKIVLEGTLKQYNYVCSSDSSAVPGTEAQAVFNSMFNDSFSAYKTSTGYVNTGIIIMTESLNTDIITDNANTGYLANDDATVKVTAAGLTATVNGAVYAPKGSGASVDNGYSFATDTHVSTTQGDYLPTFEFDLGDQMISKDNDDDTRYLIGDKNGLTAMYPKGESALTLDLTKLAEIYKYDGVDYIVTAKCIFPDGSEKTGTVTLESKGTYTLVFSVEDNIFYDSNGNKLSKTVTRTYEVTLVLDLYEKSIADATMTISSSNLTGEYISSGTNKKYKMYPLQAITSIMDDANKDGTLETFEFKKNIQSAVLTPESNNAFASPTTITITYTGGQVLTIVLGTPSGLNSPGASNGGKTFSVKTDSTNGIYLQSDGAVASSSAVTGTWPITSWSFKGTSGKVITNTTQVTINFTKPSGGCFAEGTLITLADGTQKPIEEITFEDQLLAWDFNTGKYVATVPSLIDRYERSQQNVINLKFSDGTVVRMVIDHGFFDVDANNFVFLNEENVASYVGHTFVKVSNDGTYENVDLVGYEITVEDVAYYSIQTAFYNNCIAEGMFTLTAPPEMLGYNGWFDYFEIGEGMKYDEEKMQADIEKYGLYTYEEFAEYVTYEQFMAFNGPYLKVLVGRGVVTYEQIIELIGIYVNPEN